MAEHEGGCLCGKVRFVAKGPPDRVGLCHCLACRKHHGAVFYAAAVFPRSAVTIHGQAQSYDGRHFCPACGSSVFAETGEEIELHLGAFDTPNLFQPDYELWACRKENWLEFKPGLTSYDKDRGEETKD